MRGGRRGGNGAAERLRWGGGIEETRKRDGIIEGSLIGSRSDLSQGRFPEIYMRTPTNNLGNGGEPT